MFRELLQTGFLIQCVNNVLGMNFEFSGKLIVQMYFILDVYIYWLLINPFLHQHVSLNILKRNVANNLKSNNVFINSRWKCLKYEIEEIAQYE